MKKIYSFLLCLLVVISVQSQNDCSTVYPYLTSSGISFTADTGSVASAGPDYGCLITQPNPTWFYLGICNSGTINLDVIAAGGADVDFVVWGPFTNASTMCNYVFGGSTAIDCSFAVSSNEQVNIPNAMVGEYYVLMVTNYSNLPGTISIVTGPGTTGVACDSSLVPTCVSPPPPVQQVCKVSTDYIINRNVVLWNKDSVYIGNYEVQRETATMNVYSTIGVVAATDSSIFEDTISNPIQQAFKYRIQTSDTCGNLRYGNGHKTIHLLTSYNTFTGYPQLGWSPYQGFNYYTYYIYRGTSPQTLNLYDSISASFTSYTDVSPLGGANYYSIAVAPPNPCHPWRAIDLSFSNVAPVMVTTVEEMGEALLIIYPNPSNGNINVSFGNNIVTGKLSIVDITGRQLLLNTLQNTSQFQLDASSFANGFYYVVLETETGIVRKNIVISK